MFSTPKSGDAPVAQESPSDLSEYDSDSSALIISKPANWRGGNRMREELSKAKDLEALVSELQACYKLIKEERRVNNDFHRRLHGSPSEWGKQVNKRIMERHPLFSPSKTNSAEKRSRVDLSVAVELDDIEEMIREEVLEALKGRTELCSCGKRVEMGDMLSAHVLPCPHCRKHKCAECTAEALEVRASCSCCEQCSMACGSCVRKLHLACSNCGIGRRCHGAGCGGVRCSTCFNQLCEDCRQLDADDQMRRSTHNEGPAKIARLDDDVDDEECGSGFEYFFCAVCQFRSCQDCHRKNCYCAPATRLRAPDAIPTRVEGRSMSYLFKKLGGEKE